MDRWGLGWGWESGVAVAARSGNTYRHVLGVLVTACVVVFLPHLAAADDEAVASVRMMAPPAPVWQVLTDFLAWPSIFPDLVEVSLNRAGDHPLRLRQVTRVLGMRIEHTSTVMLDPREHRLELSLDPSEPHDIMDLVVAWTITQEAGGSVVELRSRIASSHPFPGFLRRRLLERSLRASVEALAAEVARRMESVRLADGS